MTLAVVTGGSRGIGAAICRALAADGYDLLLTYHSDAVAAEGVVAECSTRGVAAQAIRADLGEPGDVEGIFAQADEIGDLTVLVNNAGVIDDSARVAELTAKRIRRILDVNVTGLLLACGQAVRRMDTGAIVNVSSRAAQRGGAGMYVDYAASKAAVETITVGLAHEVAPHIRVNAVSPGLIDTGIHRDQRGSASLAERATSVPLGRAGDPAEVAAAVRWLVSPEASYVTGTILTVSGGR